MDARKSDSDSIGKTDLDQAIEDVKRTAPRQHEVEEAAARVWARVSGSGNEAGRMEFLPEPDTLRSCDDYRSLIGRYLSGRLGRARVLLLEDHASECLGCRKSISEARRTTPVETAAIRRGGRVLNWAWLGAALAAVILVGFIAGGGGLVRQLLFPVEVSASAQTVRGRLFRVAGMDLVALRPGERIGARESIRTAAGSGAVLELTDGSTIEMRERSELRLVAANDGIRIQLKRGSVIVEAAAQVSGHLYLSTDDVDVVAIGTIFSVSEGVKGARISVIEGEVRVEQGALTRSLSPGQQFNSSLSLTVVPIEEEIGWSQISDEYLALTIALSGIQEEMIAAAESPDLRYSSMLLDLAPPDTHVYVAFPNLARTVASAYDVFMTRIQGNPVTRDWWNQLRESDGEDAQFSEETLETMMGYLSSFSGQIGDEIVLTLSGEGPDPVVLVQVRNPNLVTDVLRGIAALVEDPNDLRVVAGLDELAADEGPETGPLAYVGGDLLALSTSRRMLLDVAEAQSGGSAFTASSFHRSLASIYAEGTDWLLAADLDGIGNRIDEDIVEGDGGRQDEADAALGSLLGLDDVNDLFVDYRSVGGQATARAAMTFNQARTGIASWIADPGPMAGLDFVSPEALAVGSALTRDAGSIVSEIFAGLQRIDPDGWNRIVEFQREHRFDLEYNVAAALGGEFLLALDGPVLPTPSWKAVIEVYNWAVLQNAIERMVFEFNRAGATEGGPQLELLAESAGSRIDYVLRQTDGGLEAHYTFMGGYMVVGPSQALLNQSIQYYETQSNLSNSTAFRSLFPSGSQNDCSAVFYGNMGSIASSLADFIPESVDREEGQLEAILNMITENSPTLACVIAEDDRILALNAGDSPFGIVAMGGLGALMARFGDLPE